MYVQHGFALQAHERAESHPADFGPLIRPLISFAPPVRPAPHFIVSPFIIRPSSSATHHRLDREESTGGKHGGIRRVTWSIGASPPPAEGPEQGMNDQEHVDVTRRYERMYHAVPK